MKSENFLFNKNILLNIVGLILIIVVVWFGFEVFMSSRQRVTPNLDDEVAKPIDPNLNLDLLDSLKEKTLIN